SDKRRLMDLSLRLISKRTNCAPERSYCDRSALSTKAAAARSLLKVGIFFFIRFNLFFACTARDGTDQKFVALPPEREYDEHAAPFLRSPDRAKTVLPLRVGRIQKNGQRTRKKAFDSHDGEFLALGSIAPVPVEAIRL